MYTPSAQLKNAGICTHPRQKVQGEWFGDLFAHDNKWTFVHTLGTTKHSDICTHPRHKVQGEWFEDLRHLYTPSAQINTQTFVHTLGTTKKLRHLYTPSAQSARRVVRRSFRTRQQMQPRSVRGFMVKVRVRVLGLGLEFKG